MKQTAGNGKVSGFGWGGKRIVFYSLPYRLPYTREALARLEARLAQMNEPVQIMHELEAK